MPEWQAWMLWLKQAMTFRYSKFRQKKKGASALKMASFTIINKFS